MADHLSKLTIAHNTHSPLINDEFPEESLLLVESAPWYAHIANFVATGEVLSEWKARDKKYFFAKIHSYYWEEPFCSNTVRTRLLEGVYLNHKNKGFSDTAMKMPMEVTLLHKRQL